MTFCFCMNQMNSNAKYLRGMKRNQIIQRWLQGIEDPDYEVFPTKKEGKYIVKLRSETVPSSLCSPSGEPVKKLAKDHSCDNLKEMDHDSVDNEHDEPAPVKKPISKPSRSQPPMQYASHDSTINLEIMILAPKG